jgi:hypothetical protein
MKKVLLVALAIVIALTLGLSFVGCKKQEAPKTEVTGEQAAPPAQPAQPGYGAPAEGQPAEGKTEEGKPAAGGYAPPGYGQPKAGGYGAPPEKGQ